MDPCECLLPIVKVFLVLLVSVLVGKKSRGREAWILLQGAMRPSPCGHPTWVNAMSQPCMCGGRLCLHLLQQEGLLPRRTLSLK